MEKVSLLPLFNTYSSNDSYVCFVSDKERYASGLVCVYCEAQLYVEDMRPHLRDFHPTIFSFICLSTRNCGVGWDELETFKKARTKEGKIYPKTSHSPGRIYKYNKIPIGA